MRSAGLPVQVAALRYKICRHRRGAGIISVTMAAASEYFVIIPPSSPGVPLGHQICTTCRATKPFEEFYPRPVPGHPHRRHRQCKDCQKAKAKRRHAANPEPARQRSRKHRLNLDTVAREARRADARASHAERVRAAGRPYRPRLNARKDAAVIREEIRKLVCNALAELAHAELLANGFIQGSRAAGKESDLNMLLAPLARAQSALQQILLAPSPAQPATGDPEGSSPLPASPMSGRTDPRLST